MCVCVCVCVFVCLVWLRTPCLSSPLFLILAPWCGLPVRDAQMEHLESKLADFERREPLVRVMEYRITRAECVIREALESGDAQVCSAYEGTVMRGVAMRAMVVALPMWLVVSSLNLPVLLAETVVQPMRTFKSWT